MNNHLEYQRAWTKKNLARVRAQQRAWYQRNIETVRKKAKEKNALHPEIKRNEKLLTRYGISAEEWQKLFETQGSCCAICRTPEPGSQDWHTDHDHATKVVRGILCFNCNIGLGKFKESSDLLLEAADYLDRFR
jgi:hypothetical protein